MSTPTATDFPLPWVQRCLSETGWDNWNPHHVIGVGAWSMAILVERRARQAVLLLDRADRPGVAQTGVASSLDLYRSAAAIRLACRRVGLPVARTLGAPRPWSGGAAVLLSRVSGRDLEHRLNDPSLDGFAIAQGAARIVSTSQILAQAHGAHAHGFGTHLFGRRPPRTSALEAWSVCISPLLGHEAQTDHLISRLQEIATTVLATAPRTTQIWDIADRNIMLDENGRVAGLVDQVNMFTGDPLLVPGFSLAMLGDVHGWPKMDQYTAGWRHAWGIDQDRWTRVELHRLTCHGRFIGKRWNEQKPPPGLAAWQSNARRLLAS